MTNSMGKINILTQTQSTHFNELFCIMVFPCYCCKFFYVVVGLSSLFPLQYDILYHSNFVTIIHLYRLITVTIYWCFNQPKITHRIFTVA